MATESNQEYSEVIRLLATHPTLKAWGEEDEAHQKNLERNRRSREEVPDAFPPDIFSEVVLEAAKASGVKRRKEEEIGEWLKRAFRGKTVGVLGPRYGMLQKVFEVFGAKTYGIDKDEDAVRIAKARGLDVTHGNAAEIDSLLAEKRPHFLVSFHFFDPNYWPPGRESSMLQKIMGAIARHSTNDTIHVHGTIGRATEFPGFKMLRQTRRTVSSTVVLRKKRGLFG